jgi:hypothetical protein
MMLQGRGGRLAALGRNACHLALLGLMVWFPGGQKLTDLAKGPVVRVPPPETVTRYASAQEPGAAAFLRDRLAAEPFRYVGYDAAFVRLDVDGRRAYHAPPYFRDPLVQGLLVNNRAMRLHLQDVQGYNAVQNARFVAYLTALNGQAQNNYHEASVLPSGLDSPLLDLLNVRYFVVRAEVPPGRPDLLHLSQRHRTVFADGAFRVLRASDALPRAWIVHEASHVEGEEALRLLADGTVDPHRVALVEATPPELGGRHRRGRRPKRVLGLSAMRRSASN